MIRRAFLFSVAFVLLLMVATFIVFNSMAVRDFAKRLIVTQSYYQYGINVEVEDVRISYFRPSVRISDIKLIKEDPKHKINLSAKKAAVYFNVVKLIQGKVGISGIRLDEPNGTIETSIEDPDKNKKIDIKSIWEKILNSDVDRIRIDDGTLKLKIKLNGKERYFGLEHLNVNIRRSIISNYVIKLSSSKAELPLKQIQSFDIRADIRSNQLKLSKADIGVPGGTIYAGGVIRDFTSYPASSINVSWKGEFDLSRIMDYKEFVGESLSKDIKKGAVTAGGKISGKLSDGMKGLSYDLSLSAVDAVWDYITLPKLDVKGSYQDGSATVSKLELSDGEKSISIEEAKLQLKTPYAVSGRGVINDVELSRYLELFDIKRCLSHFYVSGPFTFTGSLSPEFKITGAFDLKVSDFWVLKEKGLELNKKNSILDFKEGSVNGNISFSKKGAYFDNVQARSEQNLLNVTGWITENSTVDLDVRSSNFSMAPYGRVSDLAVAGGGALQTKLIVDDNGDFKTQGKLDFEGVKLLNNYDLGVVSSNVVYDKDTLSFKDIKGKKGSSYYRSNTNIVFDNNNDVILKGNADFDSVYTDDLYKLFGQKDKLFGSPSAIVSGSVKFDGRPSWGGIRIDSNISMVDIEFIGERFDRLYADFTWNKGDITIDDLYLLRGKGRFDFDGGRKKGLFNLSISSNKIDVSDIGVLDGQTEVDGVLSVKGNLKHLNNKLSGDIKFILSDLMMNQLKLKPVYADLVIGDKLLINMNLFEGSAVGSLTEEAPGTYRVRTELKDFDVYPLSVFTRSQAEPFKTSMNGNADLVIDKKNGVKWAKFDLASLGLTSGFINLKSDGRVFLEYAGGLYSTNSFALMMDHEEGRCRLDLRSNDKKVYAKGCIPASSLRVFKDYIDGARGKADVDLAYDGKLRGNVYFRDVAVTPSGRRLGTINVSGKIPIENSNLKLNALNLSAGGVLTTFSGYLNVDNMLKLNRLYPSADLEVNIDKLYLEYPDGLKGKWVGSVDVKGTDLPYKVSGQMMFYDGEYRKDFELSKLAFSRPKKVEDSLTLKKKDPVSIFDVKLKSATDIYIKNTMMTGDVDFDLRLRGTSEVPKIEGSIDLLRGNFIYLDNTFSLLSGRVKLKDDDIEPVVYQLDSEAKINNYQVYLKIISDKGDPKFSVSSSPPLTEEKILILLATGDVQSDFMDQGGVTGTGGNIVSEGLGVTGSVKKNTGVGMRLKTPTAKDSSIPDIEFQKDLTNDIKVIYGKSLDDNTNKQEVNVQYDVNRNVQLKLLFEEENNENVNKDKPSNAGVDIKFKFEF